MKPSCQAKPFRFTLAALPDSFRLEHESETVPSLIEPGMRVRHPGRPDWGIGQVQSVIGDRITVNFEHAGKVLINAAVVELEIVEEEGQ